MKEDTGAVLKLEVVSLVFDLVNPLWNVPYTFSDSQFKQIKCSSFPYPNQKLNVFQILMLHTLQSLDKSSVRHIQNFLKLFCRFGQRSTLAYWFAGVVCKTEYVGMECTNIYV